MKSKKCTKCGADRAGAVCPKCHHEHKRGGARANSGPRTTKATALAPIAIDGRTHVGQRKAQEIIDALNKPGPKKPDNVDYDKWKNPEPYEIQQFRSIDDAGAKESLALRTWLYDKVSGKAMHTVNHVHDKPVEHNHTHTLSERFRIAIEKGEKRLANR